MLINKSFESGGRWNIVISIRWIILTSGYHHQNETYGSYIIFLKKTFWRLISPRLFIRVLQNIYARKILRWSHIFFRLLCKLHCIILSFWPFRLLLNLFSFIVQNTVLLETLPVMKFITKLFTFSHVFFYYIDYLFCVCSQIDFIYNVEPTGKPKYLFAICKFTEHPKEVLCNSGFVYSFGRNSLFHFLKFRIAS